MENVSAYIPKVEWWVEYERLTICKEKRHISWLQT